jgi:DNA-binding NarL/FixJ family response regulator
VSSNGSAKRIGVLLVDDHPIVRRGLTHFINQEADMHVCGEAECMESCLKHFEGGAADIVIVDIALRGASGIELIKRLHARFPELPILVLSMHDESTYAERALRAGARGYVMKHEPPAKVVEAIRDLVRGVKDLYVSEQMVARILRHVARQPDPVASPMDRLSDRELEVFQRIGAGRGTREIAEELHLSVKTIETHRAHIKQKLGLKGATELVHCASHWVRDQVTN